MRVAKCQHQRPPGLSKSNVVTKAQRVRASRPSRLPNDVDLSGSVLSVLQHPLHTLHHLPHQLRLLHNQLLTHLRIAGGGVLHARSAGASATVGDLDGDVPLAKRFGLGHRRATMEDRLEHLFVCSQVLQWRRQVIEPDRRLIADGIGPSILVELLLRVDKQGRQLGASHYKLFLRVLETEQVHCPMCNDLRFILNERPCTSLLPSDF